jgi:hypothetical protein
MSGHEVNGRMRNGSREDYKKLATTHLCPHRYHEGLQGIELVPCAYDYDIPIIMLLGRYINTTNSTRTDVPMAVITKIVVPQKVTIGSENPPAAYVFCMEE